MKKEHFMLSTFLTGYKGILPSSPFFLVLVFFPFTHTNTTKMATVKAMNTPSATPTAMNTVTYLSRLEVGLMGGAGVTNANDPDSPT